MKYFVLAMLLCSQLSWATHSTLKKGTQLMQKKKHQKALDLVGVPFRRMRFRELGDMVLSNQIMGLAHCELGKKDLAKEHFETATSLKPDANLNDLFPSKTCKKLFSEIKNRKEIEKKKREIADKMNPSRGLRWVPYGVGQHANLQDQKSRFFLVSEGIATVSAATSLILFLTEDRMNGEYVNASRAKSYRRIFWGSASAGMALAIWGIVDAHMVFNKYKKYRTQKVALRLGPGGLSGRF